MYYKAILSIKKKERRAGMGLTNISRVFIHIVLNIFGSLKLILDNRLCSGNIDQNLVIDSTCLAFYEYA
jgi:hypothetical protein